MENALDILWEGRFLRVVRRDTWEFVQRKKISGIVGIIAVTDAGKLLLVEQYRPPLGKNVVEIPAGLAGDVAGSEHENLADAARRELEEETGYRAAKMTQVAEGTASAGLSDEIITLFLAEGLVKVSAGGGDSSEEIIVHEVELARLTEWLEEQMRQGKLVDLKVYSALGFVHCL